MEKEETVYSKKSSFKKTLLKTSLILIKRHFKGIVNYITKLFYN